MKLNEYAVIEKDVNHALRNALKEYGIELTGIRARIDARTGELRYTINAFDKNHKVDGKVVNAYESLWATYAQVLGLKKEWLGRAITGPQGRYKVAGLTGKKRFKVVITHETTKKNYVIAPDELSLRIDREDRAMQTGERNKRVHFTNFGAPGR